MASIFGIIGTLIAAFLGSWLGMRRFRRERLWEQKFQLYSALFAAMNDLCEQNDQLWDAQIAGQKLAPEREESLRQAATRAWPEITKQARIGSFILSESADRALTTLLKEIEKARSAIDYFDHIDSTGAALNKALKALKEAARKDLWA